MRPIKLPPRLLLASLVAALLLTLSSAAHADGVISMRGAYYKEEATRVTQPMVSTELDVGDAGLLNGHLLVDSITSASAASGAAAEPFTERRFEGGGQYMHQVDRFRFGGGFRLSTENDYDSSFINARFEAELLQRNVTLGVNLARGSDTIDNSGSQGGLSAIVSGNIDTTLASVSASQLLSPNSIISVSYDFMYVTGFLENPYRTVSAGGVIEPERVPDLRIRHAAASTYKHYLPTDTALIAAYRFYADDWGILGHAPETRIVQEIGDSSELHLAYRFYTQSGADFYKERYTSNDPEVEEFLTGDDKLGDMTSHTMGVKLATDLSTFGIEGDWGEVRVEALGQYIAQSTHFGDALVGHAAMTVPLHY